MHDSAVGKLTRTTQAQFEEMAINHKVTGCQVLFRSGFELVLHVYTQSLHMVVMGTAALERQRCGVYSLHFDSPSPFKKYAQS